jgi:tRNA(fMet)-specific endonuclease VapC
VGLLIDTDVLILADRGKVALDLGRFSDEGLAYISTITASELLVGVHRAQDPGVRAKRTAFVESLLATLPALPVDLQTARVHAQLLAQLSGNETIGAHVALIAATALRNGYAVLTRNVKDFRKFSGVRVLEYTLPA